MVRELVEGSAKKQISQVSIPWNPPEQSGKKTAFKDFHGWNRSGFRGVFSTIDGAVKGAHQAQQIWVRMKLEHRRFIIEKIREALRDFNHHMSKNAVSETGL